jgi:hypothetical protein
MIDYGLISIIFRYVNNGETEYQTNFALELIKTICDNQSMWNNWNFILAFNLNLIEDVMPLLESGFSLFKILKKNIILKKSLLMTSKVLSSLLKRGISFIYILIVPLKIKN